MSRCDLAVLFDKEDRTYRPGEKVSGRIEVKVNKEVTCKALGIELIWQTHGKGNRDVKSIDKVVLPETNWNAGSLHAFPFEFTAPAQPLTYHGNYLNVDYYIKTRADIPWAIDPKAEEEFIVAPGKSSGDDYRAAVKKVDISDENKTALMNKWIGRGIVIVFLLILLIFLWWAFLIIGAIVGVIALMKHLANKRLGNVEVDLGDPIVASGGVIPVTISCAPGKPVRLNKISATLMGSEICVSGSGTNQTTHTNVLHKKELIIASRFHAPGRGAPVEKKGEFTLPETNAYSFKSNDNEIKWQIKIHVDIPNCPDWRHKYPIRVIPENH